MKVLDEVQYDIFRRVLEGLYASDPRFRDGEQQMVDKATLITNTAVKRLLEMGLVEE